MESEGMKKVIPFEWKSKESWGTNTHITQNRLQNEECCKRQRRTLNNDQRDNPRRRCNNCKDQSRNK